MCRTEEEVLINLMEVDPTHLAFHSVCSSICCCRLRCVGRGAEVLEKQQDVWVGGITWVLFPVGSVGIECVRVQMCFVCVCVHA